MAELLLELLSEEIPARMQAGAAADLKRLVCERLKAAGLEFDRAEAFATPRRLALVVDGLPLRQPDLKEERKGPRVDAPDRAVQGFLTATGLSSIEEAENRETDKGTFLFAVSEKKGKPTADVLPPIVMAAINDLRWPKSMRWANTIFSWVRPLHSVLAIFEGKALPQSFGLGSKNAPYKGTSQRDSKTIDFGNKTWGHRFLAPEAFEVTDFADYRKKLEAAFVILDAAERAARIVEQAEWLAGEEGLTVKDDPALVAENAGLVEWPAVLMGHIDAAFMEVPPEVLTTAMRTHQKYFALEDKDGRLAPRFLFVANTKIDERNRATITAGNERVLRARLADAKFFWDQDRKVKLAARVKALSQIVFHAKLGTLDAKTDRMQALAVEIAGHVPGAEPDGVRLAARLAKADLTTEMVGEFPELQGVMGRYYAEHDGAPPEVAEAIAEHYSPQGPSDTCPTAPVSVVVALADKLDSLVGFWAIDERPTGSRDPFALRRAALGVIRLILENRLRLPLRKVIGKAEVLYAESLAETAWDREQTIADLLNFFADRLKVHLKQEGVRHDLISAVFALSHEDDLVRLMRRVEALEKFLHSEDGEHLLTAYKRAANIVRIEEKRDGVSYDEPPIADRFEQEEEVALHRSLTASAIASSVMLENEEFSSAMSELAQVRGPVDRFFDAVTVNIKNGNKTKVRENRLRLLSSIRANMNRHADFSKIEG